MSLPERNDQVVEEKIKNVTGIEEALITKGEVEAHRENEVIDVVAEKKTRKKKRRGHVNQQEGSIETKILIAVVEDGIITAMGAVDEPQEVAVFLGIVIIEVRSTTPLVTVRDGSLMMTIQIIILKKIMVVIAFPGEKKEVANSIESDKIVTKSEVEGMIAWIRDMTTRHRPPNEGRVEEVEIISIVIVKIGGIRLIETVTIKGLQATERQREEGNATVVDEEGMTGSDMRTEMVGMKQLKIIYRGTIAKVI